MIYFDSICNNADIDIVLSLKNSIALSKLALVL